MKYKPTLETRLWRSYNRIHNRIRYKIFKIRSFPYRKEIKKLEKDLVSFYEWGSPDVKKRITDYLSFSKLPKPIIKKYASELSYICKIRPEKGRVG